METKNFAIFGLFVKGSLVESGDMAFLMDRAQVYSQKSPNKRFSISNISFGDDECPEIKEGTKVMSYFTLNDDMIIINELI